MEINKKYTKGGAAEMIIWNEGSGFCRVRKSNSSTSSSTSRFSISITKFLISGLSATLSWPFHFGCINNQKIRNTQLIAQKNWGSKIHTRNSTSKLTKIHITLSTKKFDKSPHRSRQKIKLKRESNKIVKPPPLNLIAPCNLTTVEESPFSIASWSCSRALL